MRCMKPLKKRSTICAVVLPFCPAGVSAHGKSHVGPDLAAGADTMTAESLIDLATWNPRPITIDTRMPLARKPGCTPEAISLPDTEIRGESPTRTVSVGYDAVMLFRSEPGWYASDAAAALAAIWESLIIDRFLGGMAAWAAIDP